MKFVGLHRPLAVAALVAALIAAGAVPRVRAQVPAAGGASTPSTSGNVYLAGASVRPAGPVQGDFVAFGGRVIADQPVQGDALLAGGSVDVRAPVADNLRSAGGDVAIENTVGGEPLAAGGNVTLTCLARTEDGRGSGHCRRGHARQRRCRLA